MEQNRKRHAVLLLMMYLMFALLSSGAWAAEALPATGAGPGSDAGVSEAMSPQSGEEQPAVQVNGTEYSSLTEALVAAQAGQTVTLLRDVETTETILVNAAITLNLNGYGILYVGTDGGSVIRVNENGALTLEDSDPMAMHFFTLSEGRSIAVSETATDGAIRVNGGYLTGGFGAEYGGGVYNRGSFTMSGGTILGNTALQKGGGVCNGSGGTFTMTGGSIRRNCAPIGGGVVNRNTFRLSGSPVIEDNHSGAGENAAADNICLEKKSTENTLIEIIGPLSCPRPIGVSMQKRGVFTSGLSANGSVESFTSDQSGFTVAAAADSSSIGEAELVLTPAAAPVISYESGVTLNYGYLMGSIRVGAWADKGHRLSYQWYACDDENKTNPVAVSGSGESYDIPAGKNALTTEYYFCVVTATRKDNGESASTVSRVLTVTVRKADVTPAVSMGGWIYGTSPESPKLTGNSGDGAVRYTYYRLIKPADGENPAVYDEGTDQIPTESGTYKVRVSVAESENYSGAEAEAFFTIVKAGQETPAAPEDPTQTVEEVSSDSITISVRPGEEYSIDGGETWKRPEEGEDSVTFDNLNPGTAYSVLGRAAGDENHEPSDPYEAGRAATDRAAQSPPQTAAVEGTTGTAVTVAARPGEEYSIDGGKTWKQPGSGENAVTFDGLSPDTEYQVLARKSETDTGYASEPSDPITVATGKAAERKTADSGVPASYQNLTDSEKQQADAVSEAFGGQNPDQDTAAQIVKTAEELGVDIDTVKLSGETLASLPDDSDPKGSGFALLLARSTKRSSTAMTLQWKRIKEADGYLIYGNRCGKKYKLKLLKTIKTNKTVKWTKKKLKKSTYYKYMVVAYKKVKGLDMPIAVSVTVHSATKGTKYTVASAIKLNKTEVSLKKGKTFQLKASEVKDEPTKSISAHRAIKFESSNKKVAKVSKTGKITGKGKGKTTIYAYAQNGIYKTIKVTVK